MGYRAGGLTWWLLLVLHLLYPRGFQSSHETNDLTEGALECPKGRPENDEPPEGTENCQEHEEWNTRITERWSRTTDLEVRVATDLSCYLKSDLSPVCTWRADAVFSGANFLLHFWYNESGESFAFSTANSTQCTIGEQTLYMNKYTTAWVELCWRGCCYESANITLLLGNSEKYDSPAIQEFSKSDGKLTMKWKRPDNPEPLLKEARYKTEGDTTWTEVPCTVPEKTDGTEFETCSLSLKKNLSFEIQVRLKVRDRESLWSEWSESIEVPAEIVDSPELNYSVGNLSKSGQRKLDMHWKEAKREEGQVHYALSVTMASCPCEQQDWLMNGTSLSTNISEGTYNISISASNAAGSSHARSYVIESHQQTGIPFVNVSLSDSNVVHVWWNVTKRSHSYCVEWRRVWENSAPGVCLNEIHNRGTYTHSGPVEPMTCYLIAIHGFVNMPKAWKTLANKAWKTLGSIHYYKPSKEERPQNVTVTDIDSHSAIVRWEDFTDECRGVLKEYVVTIYPSHGKNVSKAHVARTSGTHYNLKNLSAATEYTVEINGETQFGEESGISRKAFMTLKIEEKAAIWKIPVICIGILLGVFTTGGLFFFGVKRFKKLACPEVPNPFDSTAVKFSQGEIQQVYAQNALICSSKSSEDPGPVEPLIIVPNSEMDVSPVVEVGDCHVSTLWQTSKLDETGKGVVYSQPSPATDQHGQVEDLPSAYKRQQEAGPSQPSSVIETDFDDLPSSYKRQMILAPGEWPQEDEEELVEISSVEVQDDPEDTVAEKRMVLGDKDLSITESGHSMPQTVFHFFSTNEQINLKNWGKLDLLRN